MCDKCQRMLDFLFFSTEPLLRCGPGKSKLPWWTCLREPHLHWYEKKILSRRNSFHLWKWFNQLMEDEGIRFKLNYHSHLVDCTETLFDSLLSILVYLIKTTMSVKAAKTFLMRTGSVEKMQNVWTQLAAFTASVWMVSCHQQTPSIFLLLLLQCVMVGDAA